MKTRYDRLRERKYLEYRLLGYTRAGAMDRAEKDVQKAKAKDRPDESAKLFTEEK